MEVRRLENAVMRDTIDVLKADDPRLDPSMLTNRERTRVVDAIRGEFGLAACLKAVGLKRSTYYYERGAIAAGDRYAVLRARVAGLFEQGGRAWGYRTIHRMLRLDESDPIVVSEKVVRRIMREGAMRPVYLKRPKRWSSYAGEIDAPAPHLLLRADGTHDFSAGKLTTTDALYEMCMENPLCSGVTFSGGEPFCQPEALYELGSRFKAAGKHLMCYSGWTFEELLKKSGREEYVGKLLSILDVLVDGRFDISKRSLSLLFRGSSNQRLIDVPASLTNGEAVELPE